ncbi:unnamed protein product, partial [Vitis vinifera]
MHCSLHCNLEDSCRVNLPVCRQPYVNCLLGTTCLRITSTRLCKPTFIVLVLQVDKFLRFLTSFRDHFLIATYLFKDIYYTLGIAMCRVKPISMCDITMNMDQPLSLIVCFTCESALISLHFLAVFNVNFWKIIDINM